MGERNTMLKRQAQLFTAVLLILAIFSSGLHSSVFAATAASGQGTITVIGSDETSPLVPKTNITIGNNTTVYDALVQAVGADNIDNSQGYISRIKNLSTSGTYFWAIYVNGIATSDGATQHILYPGDNVSFQYTDWTKPSDHVSLNVVGENNQSIYTSDPYNIVINGSPTALQLLQVTLGANNIGLTDTKYGPMITSINGTEAKGNSYWAFYVNGQYANVGTNDYQLKPNDKISFKLESYTPSTNGSSAATGSNSTPPTTTSSTTAISPVKLQNEIDAASEFTLKNWSDDNIWGAIALKQAGKTIPSSFLAAVMTDVQNNGGNFHYITDTEKYTLAALAAGGNPTNIAGASLIESIYNGDVTKQGLNGVAYGLLALNASNFVIPDSATWTREKLIDQLLNNQQPDGHWSLSATDSSSDIDITAMVLTALAPFKDQANVKDKIAAGVTYLSSQYQASKVDNSATAAQVVIALSALDVDANGTSFTKNSVSLFQYLSSFQNTDGGFGWKSGDQSDTLSTPEGFEALVAYQLYINGKGSLYHLPLIATTNVFQQTPTTAKSKAGNPLPITATNSENLLLLGVLLVMVGMVLVYINKKRKA
jgi:hypothetical protein